MRISILLLLFLLLNISLVFADNEQPATAPILGIPMVQHLLISSKLPNPPACKGSTASKLDSTTSVLVINTYECLRAGEEEPTVFYEALLDNGSRVFLDSEEVFVSDDNYTRLDSLSDDKLKKLYANSQKAISRLKAINKSNLYESKFQERINQEGLGLLESRIFKTSEYTEGTGYSVAIVNTSKTKTIKYVTFNLVGYNPVGDPVKNPKSKNGFITIKGIGPIGPRDLGKYTWEYLWFTDVVESHKLKSITVQYMNGSKKFFSDLNSIKIPKYIADKILYGGSSE